MKAYKIKSTITRPSGGNGWNPFGDETIVSSDKEFYHFDKDKALLHIEQYINKCKEHGISIQKTKEGIWSGSFNYSTYKVTLTEIEIK